MFFGHCHRTRFRDSFCLASVFEMTVYLFTYLLTDAISVTEPTMSNHLSNNGIIFNDKQKDDKSTDAA